MDRKCREILLMEDWTFAPSISNSNRYALSCNSHSEFASFVGAMDGDTIKPGARLPEEAAIRRRLKARVELASKAPKMLRLIQDAANGASIEWAAKEFIEKLEADQYWQDLRELMTAVAKNTTTDSFRAAAKRWLKENPEN